MRSWYFGMWDSATDLTKTVSHHVSVSIIVDTRTKKRAGLVLSNNNIRASLAVSCNPCITIAFSARGLAGGVNANAA